MKKFQSSLLLIPAWIFLGQAFAIPADAYTGSNLAQPAARTNPAKSMKAYLKGQKKQQKKTQKSQEKAQKKIQKLRSTGH